MSQRSYKTAIEKRYFGEMIVTFLFKRIVCLPFCFVICGVDVCWYVLAVSSSTAPRLSRAIKAGSCYRIHSAFINHQIITSSDIVSYGLDIALLFHYSLFAIGSADTDSSINVAVRPYQAF